MLERKFLGRDYKNPLILASGVLGLSKKVLHQVALNGAGGVTIKSISWEPREGHHNPTILGWEHGMINAVGYSNPGVEEAKKEFADLKEIPVPVIGSCVGNDPEDFGRMVKELDKLPFAAIELPLSCPHTPGFGLLAGQGTPEATRDITKAARKMTTAAPWVHIDTTTSEGFASAGFDRKGIVLKPRLERIALMAPYWMFNKNNQTIAEQTAGTIEGT